MRLLFNLLERTLHALRLLLFLAQFWAENKKIRLPLDPIQVRPSARLREPCCFFTTIYDLICMEADSTVIVVLSCCFIRRGRWPTW